MRSNTVERDGSQGLGKTKTQYGSKFGNTAAVSQ